MRHRQLALNLDDDGYYATGRKLLGPDLQTAKDLVRDNHYSHSVPSGKSVWVRVADAVMCFSIPANKNIAAFLHGCPMETWELSRLWAPDAHEVVLTRALSLGVRIFRESQPTVMSLVSYADPNAGHHGGIYRAASWLYTGQSSDGRYWRGPDGDTVPRRKFHSGRSFLNKSEIESLGYEQLNLPGKHRYVRGLTKRSKKVLRRRWLTEQLPERLEGEW